MLLTTLSLPSEVIFRWCATAALKNRDWSVPGRSQLYVDHAQRPSFVCVCKIRLHRLSNASTAYQHRASSV